MINKTFERAVSEYLHPSIIDSEIPKESGTYNKFCPECFYRNGHPLMWCRKCGAKMVIYNLQSTRPTWRSYIMRPHHEFEIRDRIREFVFHFAFSKDVKKIEFDFVWSKYEPNCTTPKFIDAIYNELKRSMV